MIDTVIFDLDGVLINSKNIHFEAVNRALSDNKVKYQISSLRTLNHFQPLKSKH